MMKLLVFIIVAVCADAHSLKVFARQDGNFVEIRSYFQGNSPCKSCDISIIADNKTILKTKTDDKGTARIEITTDKFDILVDGSLGHEKQINFVADRSPLNQDGSLLNQKDGVDSQNKPGESEDSLFFIKFIFSVATIFIVFTALYFLKRKR